MAVDDETGIDPIAKDGEPDGGWSDNEVERRRQLREAREAEEERQVNGNRRGRALDDQPDEAEPTEAELFPAGSIQGDNKVTVKNIAPAATPRQTEAKMGATAIPLRGGLVRYGELVDLLVTVEAGKVEEVPNLEEPESGGKRKLLGVKDVQRFRPVHVQSAAGMLSVEQVVDLLEERFGIPRSSDKVAEVFGPQTAEQRAAAS